MKEFKIEQRAVFGIVVILVGLVLLLNSMGFIDADISIARFWPVILIVIGIVKVINFDESTFFGVILLLLGVYFQLRNLGVAILDDVNLYNIFWPSIIILFGLSMVFPTGSKKNNDNKHYSNEKDD